MVKSNIALIGFMGTGKTSVGRELAARLGWKLVETDALIEKAAGKTIAGIFREDGEIAFRELEIAAVKRVAAGELQVIACGGGVVLNSINIARLQETGAVVLLTASPAEILKRTAADSVIRPLLRNGRDPAAAVHDLLQLRSPLYRRAADVTVSTNRVTADKVADRIIEKLKGYEGLSLEK